MEIVADIEMCPPLQDIDLNFRNCSCVFLSLAALQPGGGGVQMKFVFSQDSQRPLATVHRGANGF